MHELYKKHRPKQFQDVLGQPDAIRVLETMKRNESFPHAILFTGPSGCGKTTLARIVKEELNCSDGDFTEENAGNKRGIELIRDISKRISFAPMGGDSRVWLIDECHQLTADAQGAFLKLLEDTPNHVYFMLATTNPEKLKRTIRTRCTEVVVKLLKQRTMEKLLKTIARKERFKLDDEVLSLLIEKAEGSARKALVLLDAIYKIKDPEKQIEALQQGTKEDEAIMLARALMKPNPKWVEVAKLLKDLKEDPEGLRRMVLGYARSVMLSSPKMAPRAYFLIDCFRENLFDSGKAGLAACCWEYLHPDD